MAGSSGGGSFSWKGILLIIVFVLAGYASPYHNPLGAAQSVATFLQTFAQDMKAQG